MEISAISPLSSVVLNQCCLSLANPTALVKKFFPLDKNYLLESAQRSLESELLSSLVKTAITQFDLQNNPLGLEDSFTLKLRGFELGDYQPLHHFYETICAIYRCKFGANQLEFLWNGSDHFDHYKLQWRETFQEWITKFCEHELFIQAILDLTVFNYTEKVQMIENRMNHFLMKQFGAKIDKKRGLMVA